MSASSSGSDGKDKNSANDGRKRGANGMGSESDEWPMVSKKKKAPLKGSVAGTASSSGGDATGKRAGGVGLVTAVTVVKAAQTVTGSQRKKLPAAKSRQAPAALPPPPPVPALTATAATATGVPAPGVPVAMPVPAPGVPVPAPGVPVAMPVPERAALAINPLMMPTNPYHIAALACSPVMNFIPQTPRFGVGGGAHGGGLDGGEHDGGAHGLTHGPGGLDASAPAAPSDGSGGGHDGDGGVVCGKGSGPKPCQGPKGGSSSSARGGGSGRGKGFPGKPGSFATSWDDWVRCTKCERQGIVTTVFQVTITLKYPQRPTT
jgi:hypothetical protein